MSGPRAGRRLLPLLLAGCLSFGVVGAADAPEGPTLDLLRGEGLTRIEVKLPGRIVDIALPSGPGVAPAGLVLLVDAAYEPPDISSLVPGEDDEADEAADEEGAEQDEAPTPETLPPCPEEPADGGAGRRRALYLFDAAGEGRLELIRDDLPVEARSLHRFDLEGDGWDELLLGLPGEIRVYASQRAAGGAWSVQTASLSDEGFVPNPRSRGPLSSPRLGQLRLYGAAEDGASLRPVLDVDLPLEGRVTPNGLAVTSPIPVYVGRSADGTRVFATRPQRFGSRRLKMLRIELPPEGEARVIECWAALPEPEDLLESRFLWLDDEPLLFVTSKEAGRLALFGEKRIRIFRLKADRGRTGYGPMFAETSRINLWQQTFPLLADVNGDGADDLVLGYWKGLADSKVVLDAYLRRPGLSFQPTPRTTGFNVEEGNRGYLQYGDDLDGDGLADLALLNGEGLLTLYPGKRSKNGKSLVDRGNPRSIAIDSAGSPAAAITIGVGSEGVQSWTLNGSAGAAHLIVDLDGDDRSELLYVGWGDGAEPGVVTLVLP